MTDKLAVIILDALDHENARQLGMDAVLDLMKEYNSEVLGISTLPHTALSNPMIWGGYENEDKFWVKEPGQKWTDPSTGFSRDKGQSKGEAERVWKREDFKTSFIWDDLDQARINATALHIPIVLPPLNFNTREDYSMEDYWFPDTEPRMREHLQRVPEEIREHTDRDFIAASIQMPDKWLHGIGENTVTEKQVEEHVEILNKEIKKTVEKLEEEGFDWIILGDHGSPWPGAMRMNEVRQLLPRHRKESVIISNLEEIPDYTDEIYPFLKNYFGVETADFEELEFESTGKDSEEIKEKLENLGYRS